MGTLALPTGYSLVDESPSLPDGYSLAADNSEGPPDIFDQIAGAQSTAAKTRSARELDHIVLGPLATDTAANASSNPGQLPNLSIGPAPRQRMSDAQQQFNRSTPPATRFVRPAVPAPRTYQEDTEPA